MTAPKLTDRFGLSNGVSDILFFPSGYYIFNIYPNLSLRRDFELYNSRDGDTSFYDFRMGNSWGIYELNNDTITMETWRVFEGSYRYDTFYFRGIMQSDGSFILDGEALNYHGNEERAFNPRLFKGKQVMTRDTSLESLPIDYTKSWIYKKLN
jgi:hypothetical protein